MNEKEALTSEQSGTGSMQAPLETLRRLESRGYTASFSPRYGHLEASGQCFGPADFEVDELIRFENTSDPDDQGILYAIRCPQSGLKGTFLESYGLYTDDHSPAMLERLGRHLH